MNTTYDEILLKHFMEKIEVLETLLQGKLTRKDILQRQKYLGIIAPRLFRYKQARLFKMMFSLKPDQKLSIEIDILEGKNKDIDFCIGDSKRIGKIFRFQNPLSRIQLHYELEYKPRFTGIHCFNFSNLFSVWTTKNVRVKYHLENGRTQQIEFEV